MSTDNNTMYTLCFVDNQVLIAQEYGDINYMACKLIEEYQRWGLDIDVNKTENLCVGGEQRNLTLENGKEIIC